MKRTTLLSPGDTVGVVATGFAVRRSLLDSGVARLRRMGYRVRLGDHVLDREGYLAGRDVDRGADLHTMLRDPDVRAIWFARGGYGTAPLLEQVPWPTLKKSGKLLIGYSDLTALFCPTVQRTGQICLYGPVVTELGQAKSYHRSSLTKLLRGEATTLPFLKRQVLSAGRARGRLTGGNLTVLTHLAGTRFAPNLRGGVLFLEEIGEESYRLDRMLTQLRQSGAFRDLAGVLLGNFTVPKKQRVFPPDRSLRELLEETFGGLGVPVVTDLPVGHIPGKWTLPLGGTAEIDTRTRRIRFAP